MITTGILNPHINSLLARVRHTNLLVIADRGFPYWPAIETVDISLVDGIPAVLQVLNAIRPTFAIGEIFKAQEFLAANPPEVCAAFVGAAVDICPNFEPHVELKKRVPGAVGLIRAADTIQYANMILFSA